MTPRAILGWGGFALVATLCATCAILSANASRQAAVIARYEACEAAVQGKPKAKPAALVCSAAIATADLDADRERACSAALGAKPENTFAIRMTCGLPTKAVVAQRDAAAARVANLEGELKTERGGQAAALRRAQLAGQTQAERKAKRDAAVQAAPRDADGLAVCDDRCLRDRWGQ